MGGLGGPVQFGPSPSARTQVGQAETPNPFASPGNQPSNQPGPAPDATGPGFGRETPSTPEPAQPTRQNLADELTDFHVPPQSTLQTRVASETPMTIPGGHLITTGEVKQMQGMQVLIVDVLNAPRHPSIPGAQLWAGAGDPGSFTDETQQKLWQALAQATHKTPTYPIVFLCAGARCWESYNAALRAANMGFKTVLWYRGGLASWRAAGLPMTGGPQPAAQGGQGGIGFGADQ